MKILELHLLAFGPFTDLCLNLADGEQGMHILFGPNEAGKSSALRALKAWLYGIPHGSTDNFKHDNTKLRVGGRIRHSDGSELVFLRRKGNKNTLLGLDEKPIDNTALDKFLHGVGEQLFSTVFGIDHEALVRGGQDILLGGGEAGQSLFAAGLGGTNVRRVLQDLENEAKLLFLPRGQNQAVNMAISAYNEAKRIISEASLSGRDWSEHDKALKKAGGERKEVREKLQRLVTEKNRLERLQKVLPKIAKRKELLTKLNDLGDVVILPPEFTDKRRKAIQKLESALDTQKRTSSDLDRLNKEIQALTVPEPLLDQAEVITKLHQRLGSHQKAAQDRTKLQGSQQQLEADARALLSELGPNLTLEQAGELRLSTAHRIRIHELGGQYQTLVNNLDRAKKDVQNLKKELAEATEELKTLEFPRDPSELRRAVEQARKRGDLEDAHQKALVDLEAEEEQTQVDLKRLGLWSGTIEELERLPVSPPETVDRFESRFHDLETQRTGLEGRIKEIRAELSELERKIEELRLVGAVPSEEELMKARQRRDRGWKLVRRAWINKEDIAEEKKTYDPENDLPEAYEKTVSYTDEVADRLRREADRVAKHAALFALQVKYAEDLEKLEEERRSIQSQLRQLHDEWAALWQPTGITPLPPREMRSWMARQNKLLQRAERVRTCRREADLLKERIEEYRAELSQCLERLGEKTATADETLDALLERSQAMIEMIEESNRLRKELQTKIKKLRSDLDGSKHVEEESAAKIEQWQAEWEAAVSGLGLTGKALPAEVNAVLDKLEELFKKLDEAEALGQRIHGIERDAEEFAADVKALVYRLAPDLGGLSADQAVAQLNVRLSRAQRESERLSGLKKQVEEKQGIFREAKDTIQLMTEQLDALCRQAGCSRCEELEAVEGRSARFQALRKDIETLEEQLVELGGGATIEQLIQEAEEVNADFLPMQISEISQQVEELQNTLSQLEQTIGREQALLEQMDGSAKAAEAAEKAQGILAAIRVGVDRYVRLRLASAILRREIGRYRAENQEPLLGRASKIFSRLTLGSFSGLQTDFNERDEPILLGARPSGERVGVEGMSDGTRDQMYLSLRLASLERYMENNEPIPFIVDDILIKFDDHRAEATLKVLTELSAKTQVIFFTHQSRLMDLVRGAECDGLVKIHRLWK